MLYLRHLGGLPRIAVKFDDYSAEVKIETALLGGLANTARAANRIYLHAHTDAFVGSDAGTDLAVRRAVAVRSALVSLHVEPERIRLFFRGTGQFVANNSTREGKALNRRVEIELRKW
jgi:OOP family OmpA-OmpF porin